MNEQEKETQVEINPHGVMGDFVHVYETLIKPGIREGNVAGARGAIGDACSKFGVVEKQIGKLKEGSYVPYRMALSYLKGILEENAEEKLSAKQLESLLVSVNIQVGKLDLIMHGDEAYEKHRHRQTGEKNENK